MKVGMRTPSPTRTVKAKTTGRIKRAAKKSYNPVYGIKGIGYLKDPERAVKNKIYHKLTVDPLEPIKHPSQVEDYEIEMPEPRKGRTIAGLFCLIFLIAFIYTLFKLVAYRELHIIPMCIALVSLIIVWITGRVKK